MSQEDLGEILFSLCYLPAAGRLNVDILRAKQLVPTDLVGGAGNCFFLHLMLMIVKLKFNGFPLFPYLQPRMSGSLSL